MVHLEVVASLYAVETVRIMTHVTGETEHVLIVLLDGKINIVINVRKNTSNAHLGLNIKITEKHSYKIITMNVKRNLLFRS